MDGKQALSEQVVHMHMYILDVSSFIRPIFYHVCKARNDFISFHRSSKVVQSRLNAISRNDDDARALAVPLSTLKNSSMSEKPWRVY